MSNTVLRYVFKEQVEGDLEKYNATSSTSGTGGGARDIRLRQPTKFDPVFATMFSGRVKKTRTENGLSYAGQLYTADVAVHHTQTHVPQADSRMQKVGSDLLLVQNLEYWPAGKTGRYRDESRIGRVNTLRLNPPTNQGRVFLMIFQDGTSIGRRLVFVTEDAVRQGGVWEKSVNDVFAEILDVPAPKTTVMGYCDLVKKTSWSNI